MSSGEEGEGSLGPWRPVLLAGLVALAALAAYARTAGFPFVALDDHHYVVGHPRVERGLDLDNLRWALFTFDFSNWHPLTWLSYMLDVELFGVRPGPMHLVNAALHAANAGLLALFLGRAIGARVPAAAAAAMFALHPVHVESVAWVSERKDVLSLFFGLLALLAYLRHARRPSAGGLALVGLGLAASLSAKPTLVTLPFVLLLLDAWPLGRFGPGGPGPGRLVLEKLPLFALSAVGAGLALAAQHAGGSVGDLPLLDRLANAATSLWAYAGKLVWPAGLAVFYPLPMVISPWRAAAGGALAAAATVGALALGRRAPSLAVGWLWFAGALVPMLGIVQVGGQAMADRYLYFPALGIYLAVTSGLAAVARGRPRPAAVAAVAVVLGALAVAGQRQLDPWADGEALFRRALQATGPNPKAHELLATELLARGRLDEARGHLVEAIRLDGDPMTLTNLGVLERRLGRPADAERMFRAALALDPGQVGGTLALADLLLSEGRREEAAGVAAAAEGASGWARAGPDELIGLGAALVDAGRPAAGVRVIERAVVEDPRNPAALAGLAGALWHAGDRERAERVARESIARGDRTGAPLLVVAAAARARGDLGAAVDALCRAKSLAPGEAVREGLLAEVLRESGSRCP